MQSAKALIILFYRSRSIIDKPCLLHFSRRNQRKTYCSFPCAPRRTIMSNMGQENGAGEQNSRLDSAAKSEFLGESEIGRGKWVALKEYTYRDPKGKERKWEVCERTTRNTGQADGVMMVAILRRVLHYDCVIFVKQYRPPLKAYTLEFPAGLIDRGETPHQAALRELKEETGYVATIKHCSPATSLDAGMENCTINMVTADIDGDEEVNKNPKPINDDGEFIEVIHIPINTMLEKLNEYSDGGVVIDSRCYTYGIALTQATKEKHLLPAQK